MSKGTSAIEILIGPSCELYGKDFKDKDPRQFYFKNERTSDVSCLLNGDTVTTVCAVECKEYLSDDELIEKVNAACSNSIVGHKLGRLLTRLLTAFAERSAECKEWERVFEAAQGPLTALEMKRLRSFYPYMQAPLHTAINILVQEIINERFQ